jgi:hypothetical protein
MGCGHWQGDTVPQDIKPTVICVMIAFKVGIFVDNI